MREEEAFSEQQGLALIESMINRAKDKFSENGHLYLLWGWVVFVCSIVQFLLAVVFHYSKGHLVWALTWAAVLYQLIYLARRNKARKVRTYTDEILAYVWTSFFITMMLMGFVVGVGIAKQPGTAVIVYPMFLTLYGIPSFLSGIILRFKPLIWGAVCCWLLALFTVFVSLNYQLLCIAFSMVFAWIIPGYLLRIKFKKENA